MFAPILFASRKFRRMGSEMSFGRCGWRLNKNDMAPQRRATRIGTSARQTASAVFQLGEKKNAASNSAERRILAARAKTDSLPNSMVRLISGVSRQISAKSRGVRTANQVSG